MGSWFFFFKMAVIIGGGCNPLRAQRDTSHRVQETSIKSGDR